MSREKIATITSEISAVGRRNSKMIFSHMLDFAEQLNNICLDDSMEERHI